MKENQMIRWLMFFLLFSTVFSSTCNKKKKEFREGDSKLKIDETRAAQRAQFLKDNGIKLFNIDDLSLNKQLDSYISNQKDQKMTTEKKKRMLFLINYGIELVTLDNSLLQKQLDAEIDFVSKMIDDDEDSELEPHMIEKIESYQKAFKFFDDNKMDLFDLDDQLLELNLIHEIAIFLNKDTTSESTEDKIEMIKKLQKKFKFFADHNINLCNLDDRSLQKKLNQKIDDIILIEEGNAVDKKSKIEKTQEKYIKDNRIKFIAENNINVTEFNYPELKKKLDNEINLILAMNEPIQIKINSIKAVSKKFKKEDELAKKEARKKEISEAKKRNDEEEKEKENDRKKALATAESNRKKDEKENAKKEKEKVKKEKEKAKKEQEMKENARKDAETERKNKEDAAKKTTNSDSGCTITISLVAAAVVFVGLVSFFLWRKDFCSIKEYDTDEEEAAEKQVTPVTPPRDNLEVLESKTSEELVAYHPMVYPSVDQSMSEDTNSADGSYRSGTLDDHDRMIQLNDHVSTMRTTNHASRNSVLEVWPKESHDDYESKDYNEDE